MSEVFKKLNKTQRAIASYRLGLNATPHTLAETVLKFNVPRQMVRNIEIRLVKELCKANGKTLPKLDGGLVL
jgi:DNA-directed RNA polymerase sigma subunit (sigma70/sigma32)